MPIFGFLKDRKIEDRFFTIYFHGPLHGNTGDYKGLQRVTGGYEGLHGVTGGYRGLQRVTGGYKGLPRGYRGLQRIRDNFF